MSTWAGHAVCLVVGNGLTYDFVSEVGPGIDTLNPARPLWNFNSQSISYEPFMQRLSAVRDHLVKVRTLFENDFVAIKHFVPHQMWGFLHSQRDCQLRRFLALAYASFQMELDQYSFDQWRWSRWLRTYSSRVHTAISFNYDLVLERALRAAGLSYYRVGSGEIGRVPLIKPHGSLDFELPQGLFEFGSDDAIWDNYFVLNDAGSVRVLPIDEWLKPRIQPDLVPPSYQNFQTGLRWVRRGYEAFQRRASSVDTLVIVGFSYQDVDRNEFDHLIDSIPTGAPVYVVDPKPSADLLKKLGSSGFEVHPVGSRLPEL